MSLPLPSAASRVASALLCLACVVALGASAVDAQPAPGPTVPARAGFQIRFAMVGSAGGLEGRAFLPTVPSDVRALAATSECPAGIELRGRSLRGYVRSIVLTLRATGAGDVAIDGGPCAARLEATLEDGRTLRDGEGTVTVETWHPEADAAVHFAWTPRLGREPMPFHGSARAAFPR